MARGRQYVSIAVDSPSSFIKEGAGGMSANIIYQLLGVAKTTALARVQRMKKSELCKEIAANLEEIGITADEVINQSSI